MTCIEVRDRLTDYVLSGLPEDETRAVARHLEWCAGCRKELAELQEGVATVGWALDPIAPPEELEERVLEVVADATGARVRERRRFRLMTAVAVLASFVAVAAAGWAMVTAGRLERLEASERRATNDAEQLSLLNAALAGQQILAAPLTPTEGNTGGGRALVTLSGGRGSDWVLVIAGGLPANKGPYKASMVHSSGVEVQVGRMFRSKEGQLSAYRSFTQDLSRFGRIIVTNRLGQVVLQGAVRNA